MTSVYIVYYSMYGHIKTMADAVAEGARTVPGVEVKLWQVPETLSDPVLTKMGASKSAEHPIMDEIKELARADAIIFGTPTRFGNMCAQMRAFLDRAGGLWEKGSLVGKVGSVFTSTGTQHGGQETTITSFYSTLLHLGMVISGVPYTCAELSNMKEITGGSPYGAGTLSGADGARAPSKNELAIARFQGEHVAKLARKLK